MYICHVLLQLTPTVAKEPAKIQQNLLQLWNRLLQIITFGHRQEGQKAQTDLVQDQNALSNIGALLKLSSAALDAFFSAADAGSSTKKSLPSSEKPPLLISFWNILSEELKEFIARSKLVGMTEGWNEEYPIVCSLFLFTQPFELCQALVFPLKFALLQKDVKDFTLSLSSIYSPWKALFDCFHSVASATSHVTNQDVFHLLESLLHLVAPMLAGNYMPVSTPTKGKKKARIKLGRRELVLLAKFTNVIVSSLEISGQSSIIGFNSLGIPLICCFNSY